MPPPRDHESPISPLPIPADAAPVVLVGGQFDPPHLAHTRLASAARDQCSAHAWLVFVPAARSPLKGDALAPDEHRVAMVRLAVQGLERTAIWTDEIDRAAPGQPSYWLDTLRRARVILPAAAPIRFVIGADQAVQFHRWRGPREILALAEPLVLLRHPWDTRARLLAALRDAGEWTAPELEQWGRRVADGPLLPVSSTDIRAALSGPPSAPLALDPRVAAYIRAHHLYGC